MAIISVFCLVVVAVLCIIGALHPRYHDNLLQCIGMGATCLSSLVLAHHVIKLDRVDPACLLLAGGLLSYSIGVALKVRKFAKG
jgi:predicted membrane channel-forming protein YqfA (hemolysin III family)